MTEPVDSNNTPLDVNRPLAPREFRVARREGLVLGVCQIYFMVIWVRGCWDALTNADGTFSRPIESAVVFGLSASLWTGLCTWGLLDWWKHRLIVGTDTLHYVGVVRDLQISRDDLVEVRWRGTYRRGVVVIRTTRSRLRINLARYSRDERDDLIDCLHRLARDIPQPNWETFSQFPLKRSPEELRREAIWNASICCGLMLATSIACAAIAAAWGPEYLLYPVSVALAMGALVYLGRMRWWVLSTDNQSARL